MVGLPRAGKTTAAKTLGCPIVNTDAIREVLCGSRRLTDQETTVWQLVDLMIKALFRAGHETVILDACNVTRSRRDAFYWRDWRTLFWFINTPVHTCIARAGENEELAGIIRQMSENFEPLGRSEAEWMKA